MSLRSKMILLVSMCLISSQVFAVIGPMDNLDIEDRPGVCRMILRTPGSPPSICTGFLIAPDLFMSAAHCLDGVTVSASSPLNIQCGFEGHAPGKVKGEKSGAGNLIMTDGIIFSENIPATKILAQNKKTDQVIIQLSKPSKIRPFQVLPFDKTKIKKCWTSGYGLNIEVYAGWIVTAELNSDELPFPKDDGNIVAESFIESPVLLDRLEVSDSPGIRELIKNINKSTITSAAIAPGDSGGPLFCEMKDGRIAAVGVTSATGIGRALDLGGKTNYNWGWHSVWKPIDFNLLKMAK